MPARPTQAQLSSTRPHIQALATADQALRSELSALTRDAVGWAVHLAARYQVPVATILASRVGDLERDIAVVLVDVAEQVAQRAMADKTTPPIGTDILRTVTTRIYTRLKAAERAQAAREQAQQMADLKATLRERGLL